MDFPLKRPQYRELVGGDLLAQCLSHLGVTVAFGIHGGHLDSFLVAAVEADIKLVDVRHETVAVQAAEGWAKVKGNGTPGVCFVTANSGFCNGLPGLATAYADRSPVFCITSSPPMRDAETNSLQGFHDQVVLARPVTKFAHRITSVSEIPRIVSLAWRMTTAGALGPVLVDFPIDILFMPINSGSVSWGSIMSPPVSLPAPSNVSVEKAMELWRRAERPIIIVSTGASGATTEVINLAESTNTPVFHSPKFSTSIFHYHPLFGGSATQLPLLHSTGSRSPDFVLLLGVRSGFLMGGRSGAIIPNDYQSKVVQVDLDGSEIGRSTNIDIGIVADVRLTAAAMGFVVEKSSFKASDAWVQQAIALKKSQASSASNRKEPIILPENKRLHPYHGVSTLFRSLPDGCIICIDGGEASGWATQCLNEANAGLSMASTGYLGFLGNGFGYSLGAAVADPDRLVVNMQGDGSAGFHLSELDTFVKFDLKILTVVVNNAIWGMSQAGQDMIYGEKTPQRPCVAMNPKVKYDIIAQGFGCRSAVVDVLEGDADGTKTIDLLYKTVKDITSTSGPALLDLKVSNVPYHGTTKAMVGNSSDPNVIVVPYYDNLPRPFYRTSGII